MLRLFHVSDLHFGFEDKPAIEWFAAVVEAERPDAVICTGDLTMHALEAEFEAAATYLNNLPVPVSVIVGNHDLPYNPLRFVQPYKRFDAVAAGIDQPVALDALAIIPLKTTARFQMRLNWSKGIVHASAMETTIAAVRAEREAGRQVIVVCHHPLVEGGTRTTASTRGGPEALEALAGEGVSAVLTGHVHDPFDRVLETGRGPIRMIGAGTLSERVRATPPSFNRITIADDGDMRVVVESWDGSLSRPQAAIVPEDGVSGEAVADIKPH